METLPSELMNKILSYVVDYGNRDGQFRLGRLRMTSKAMKAVCTPWVFDTVGLWIGLQSLRHLTLISENSELAPCVGRIVFEPLRMKTDRNTDLMHNSMKEHFDYENTSINLSNIALIQYLGADSRFAAEQTRLDAKDTDRAILVRALRKLDNIKTIEIITPSWWIGADAIFKAFGHISRPDMFQHDPLRQINVLMHALKDAKLQITSLRVAPEEGSWGLELMANGLYCSHLEGAHCGEFGMSAKDFRAIFDRDNHAWSHLENLHEIKITVPAGKDTSELAKTCKMMKSILCEAHNLKILGIAGDCEPNYSRKDLTRMLKEIASVTLNDLETLHLYNLPCQDLMVLSAFLIRHHCTLKNVHLWKVEVVEDGTADWSGVLEELAKTHWESLKTLKLTQCVNDELELELAGFILGRVQKNPLIAEPSLHMLTNTS